jgi:lipopolysaccharide biosynthesis protein/glycosyltransferase involved in cell wall biosynthesis
MSPSETPGLPDREGVATQTDGGADVVLIGHPWAPDGGGEALRAACRALRSVGACVRVHNLYGQGPGSDANLRQEFGPYLTDQLSPTLNIFYLNGDEIAEVFRRLGPSLPLTSYKIIWPIGELARYPREWAKDLARFDEVWVTSQFSEASLRAAVSIPVSRMPRGIEPRVSRFHGRRHFGIPEAPFVFLFICDVQSSLERTNPGAVLEAFRRLQRRRPLAAVRLVIKLANASQPLGKHQKFSKAVGEAGDDVLVIDRLMTEDESRNLLRCCDCVVALHRSEGGSVALAEAMYFRKPVIAPGDSSNMEFMSEDTAYLVPCRLGAVPEGNYPQVDGQLWAAPDIEAAVDAMLRLLDDRAYRQILGNAAGRHLRVHFSYREVGAHYVARVAEIMVTARLDLLPPAPIRRQAPDAASKGDGPATPLMDDAVSLLPSSPFRLDSIGRAVGYVPDQLATLPTSLPARVLAFYLPQFYPIPENDRWRGKGFSEWFNVARALPQVEGQHQPRLPGELGFYDLRIDAVHRRQLELAQHYGLGGFCYYFYWFEGKRLLEAPLLRHLEDLSATLPFCLYWANENWTRGAEDGGEVLIAQEHSPADDLAFIDYVSRYLRDPRYLRVDDRPLLIVSRPSLLPDPRATAQRWRERCRADGVGEILLAFSDAFDHFPPAHMGFDAAIEFAPNPAASSEITTGVRRLNSQFRGRVYDWRCFIEHSRRYEDLPYLYFRSVNPGWDDEARKPGRSDVFLHASPRGYESWLANALRDAVRRFPKPDHRVVFVNAWNRWAEAAYLEPDARLGYAYLEATRRALTRVAAEHGERVSTITSARHVCVVVHAYYPELLDEILALLRPWEVPYRLILTTAAETEPAVRERLACFGLRAECRVYENRGRDILPFLRVANELADAGEELLLKLHTKRSLHRRDGDIWRRDLLTKLVAPENAQRFREAFGELPRLGMIAPEGHVLSMRFYWGSNRENVHYLCRRLSIREADPAEEVFAAGSMFWARLDALRPLLNLHLDESEFEAEGGQVDGTMAHAIERVTALAVKQSGLYLASTSQPSMEAAPLTDEYAHADWRR